jgi:3-oxoacyl-[acyl-carrier protein] reductase
VRLKDRTAIVTGAAQGLGLAFAARFFAEGATVVLADVNAAKLTAVAERLDPSGKRARAVPANVAKAADVKTMVETAVEAFGRVDILVNNAGGAGDILANDIEDTTEQMWDEVLGINLKGTFLCSKAVTPHMKRQKYGRIVNISSALAKGVGRPQGTNGAILPYASSKAGILGFTYLLAKQLAPWNITVNAVMPGFMLTEEGTRVRAWFDGLSEPARAGLLSRNSMGRPGKPEELASMVLFLASEEASYVSGSAHEVHGAG